MPSPTGLGTHASSVESKRRLSQGPGAFPANIRSGYLQSGGLTLSALRSRAWPCSEAAPSLAARVTPGDQTSTPVLSDPFDPEFISLRVLLPAPGRWQWMAYEETRQERGKRVLPETDPKSSSPSWDPPAAEAAGTPGTWCQCFACWQTQPL